MKILDVAYACDPYRGSESGVGWAAVCRIARHHDVWVQANDGNRAGWERGASEGIIPSAVHVRFLRKSRNHLKNRFLNDRHVKSCRNVEPQDRGING